MSLPGAKSRVCFGALQNDRGSPVSNMGRRFALQLQPPWSGNKYVPKNRDDREHPWASVPDSRAWERAAWHTAFETVDMSALDGRFGSL